MKKIIAFLSFSVLFLSFSVTQTFAQSNTCNQRCEFDTDCGSGYSCYVGVCRLQACPASSTCACGSQVSPTPVSSPKATPITSPTPKSTAKPSPTASPKATASASAVLKRSPKTGASSWVLMGLAGLLFVAGTGLAGMQAKRSS